jgi:NADH:ubiquinone oxidoreductase subunit 2 (subunit N)
VLFSVIGAYYYLRVVKLMYFDEPTDRAALQGGGSAMQFVLSLNGLAVLALGCSRAAAGAVRAGHPVGQGGTHHPEYNLIKDAAYV